MCTVAICYLAAELRNLDQIIISYQLIFAHNQYIAIILQTGSSNFYLILLQRNSDPYDLDMDDLTWLHH